MRLIDRIAKRQPEVARASVLVNTWPGQKQETPKGDFTSWIANGFIGNSVVFQVEMARLNLFTEARPKFRDLRTKRLFGSPALGKLEKPWTNGTAADLLSVMEIDSAFAGTSFIRDCGSRLERLRPDWTDIVKVVDDESGAEEVLGYVYRRDGVDDEFYPADEVVRWAPIPDPLSTFRGVAWLTPVIREVNNDLAMTQHKTTFFENAATPNLVIRYQRKLDLPLVEKLRERFAARYEGTTGSKTMVLDEGADLTVVGNSFEQMAFTAVQAAGETRVAGAGSVPPIVAGLKEGLDAATFSNYATAFRAFGSVFMRSHWRSWSGAVAPLVEVPDGAELWFDTSDIAALQEAEAERAAAAAQRASTISTYLMAGFTPDSAVNAVLAGDESLLVHTGALSVQLYPEGKAPAAVKSAPMIAEG